MEHFVTTVYGWKPLTIITKDSILDTAAVLDVCGDHEKIKVHGFYNCYIISKKSTTSEIFDSNSSQKYLRLIYEIESKAGLPIESLIDNFV